MKHDEPKDFDEYARRFPAGVQRVLATMRATIAAAAPGATERISYGMPAFAVGKRVVSFGAFTNHIGFYPGAKAIAAFDRELNAYERAKGSVQFPLDEPLPTDLVKRVVRFVAERS